LSGIQTGLGWLVGLGKVYVGWELRRRLFSYEAVVAGELSRDILALDGQHCRLITGLLTGHYTLKQLLNVMGLLGSSVYRNCWQGEQFSYHLLCQCPAVGKIGIETFGAAWLGLINVRKASIRMLLVLALCQGS
jgi:hypothetical protein